MSVRCRGECNRDDFFSFYRDVIVFLVAAVALWACDRNRERLDDIESALMRIDVRDDFHDSSISL